MLLRLRHALTIAAALAGLLASDAGVAAKLGPLDEWRKLAAARGLRLPSPEAGREEARPAVRWAPPAADFAGVSRSLRSAVSALVEQDGTLLVQVEGHGSWQSVVEGCEGEAASASGGLRWRRCRGLDELLWAAQDGVEQLFVVHKPGTVVAERLRLPAGYRAVARGGIVELRDGRGATRGRVRAEQAWDAAGQPVAVRVVVEGDRLRFVIDGQPRYPIVIDPLWTDAGATSFSHLNHTATLLPTGQVLIAGGETGASGVAELYEPSTGTFSLTGTMRRYRVQHAAALLPSGKVLLAGGSEDDLVGGQSRSTAEFYDPATGEFSDAPLMLQSFNLPQATVLLSGDVLFTGAQHFPDTPAPENLFRASSGLFVPTALGANHVKYTSSLLPSGQVFLFGEEGEVAVYDPAADAFHELPPAETYGGWYGATATLLPGGTRLFLQGAEERTVEYDLATGPMLVGEPLQKPRVSARTVLTADGKVLVIGGNPDPQIERFDPVEHVFLPAGALLIPRTSAHSLTLLPSGKILVVGGAGPTGPTSSAELVDPGLAGSISSDLAGAGACLFAAAPAAEGALLLGGLLARLATPQGGAFTNGAARFRAATGLMESLPPPRDWLFAGSAFRLASGEVFFTGEGKSERYDPRNGHFLVSDGGEPSLASSLLLSPDQALLVGGSSARFQTVQDLAISPGPTLQVDRQYPALARLPSGKVLILGGSDKETRGEIVDPEMPQSIRFTKGSMATVRGRALATPISVAGSWRLLVSSGTILAPPGLELFDPESEQFELLDVAPRGVDNHSATLLPSGKVLFAGGTNASADVIDTADLFDPATLTVSPSAGTMREPRMLPRATTLDDGRLLIAGSCDPHREIRSFELYDPATDSFSHPPTPFVGRQFPTMTLLPSGEVLLAGGSVVGATPLASAELLAPDASASTAVGPMAVGRREHTATQLPGGDVLLLGGSDQASAEIFRWSARSLEATTSPPAEARKQHASLLLGTGEVLITGGLRGAEVLGSTELYSPTTGVFRAGPPLLHARRMHGLARLPSGRVLVVGGNDATGVVSATEVFDPLTNSFAPGGDLPVPAVGISSNPLVGGSQPSALQVVGSDSGGVIVAGNRIIFRYDPESASLLYLEGGPDEAFSFALTPLGDLVACGGISCLADVFCRVACVPFSPAANATFPFVHQGINSKGAAGLRLASGDLLLQAAVARAQGVDTSFSIYREAPVGVPRPGLLSAPGQLVPGQTAELQGSRFRARAVVGGESLPATEAPPAVVFLPVASGEPVRGEILSWQDDHLTFRMQRSSQHGPGWLHVLVEGVPSAGLYAELQPVARGAACSVDGECASGRCAEGVCCDRGCSGGCESCLAARRGGGVDGECGPLAAGQPPRAGCEHDGAQVCSPTGLCDGSGGCELPPTTTDCSSPTVPAGRCFGGACVVPPPASCEASGTRAIDDAGRATDCAPFRCRDGSCLSRCTSRLDCADGLRCADEGRCLPLLDAEPPASCAFRPRIGRLSGGGVEAALGGLLALAAAARRRRPRLPSATIRAMPAG